jgi:hypothetical protein
MGVANRDSSLLTMKRRGQAEHSYYQQWYAATVGGGNPQYSLTSPAKASAEVITQIALGCSTCAAVTADANGTDRNLTKYPFNPSSGGAGRGF